MPLAIGKRLLLYVVSSYVGMPTLDLFCKRDLDLNENTWSNKGCIYINKGICCGGVPQTWQGALKLFWRLWWPDSDYVKYLFGGVV